MQCTGSSVLLVLLYVMDVCVCVSLRLCVCAFVQHVMDDGDDDVCVAVFRVVAASRV